MKKGLSLILTAVFLTAMLMVGGMSALAAGEADPEDAKSVLDLSYLTKDQALDGSAGAAVYQDQAFDNSKLKLSCVTVDGKDWLKYEYGAWFNGLLVDLNTAKGQDPAKGVTDWTGATMVWFYVDAENGATLDLQLRAVKGEDTGFFSSKNAGVKYYYQDQHGNVPVTLADDNNDWGHISLAEGYEGWVGVELANFACGSGHLTDQNLSSYLGNVTGVGFYAEKTFLVRDIRVTGVAKGLEDLNEPVVPADVSPEDAKPVADFSYLPENRVLTLADGIGGVLGDSMVTSGDLAVSMSMADGKAWLNYERNNTNWNGGIYVDLLNAAAKGKGRHRLDRCGNLLVLCPDRGGHLYQRCGGGRQRVFRGGFRATSTARRPGLSTTWRKTARLWRRPRPRTPGSISSFPRDMTAGSASTCPRWSAVPGI